MVHVGARQTVRLLRLRFESRETRATVACHRAKCSSDGRSIAAPATNRVRTSLERAAKWRRTLDRWRSPRRTVLEVPPNVRRSGGQPHEGMRRCTSNGAEQACYEGATRTRHSHIASIPALARRRARASHERVQIPRRSRAEDSLMDFPVWRARSTLDRRSRVGIIGWR